MGSILQHQSIAPMDLSHDIGYEHLRVSSFRQAYLNYSLTQCTQTCALHLCVLWSLLRSFARGRVPCSSSTVLSCGTIEPSEFCHGFSNRYPCLLYLFPDYVEESGQESFLGSVLDDVSDRCC